MGNVLPLVDVHSSPSVVDARVHADPSSGSIGTGAAEGPIGDPVWTGDPVWVEGRGWVTGPELAAPHDLRLLPMVEEEDEDGGWQERALCAQTDPEAFFPEKGGSTREAKKVCLGCDVRGECLEYALANDERFGIWGGLSERERRRLKKSAV